MTISAQKISNPIELNTRQNPAVAAQAVAAHSPVAKVGVIDEGLSKPSLVPGKDENLRSVAPTNYINGIKGVSSDATTLEGFYHWEKNIPNRPYLNQPLPNSKMDTLTWGRYASDVRKMAQHLKNIGLQKGDSVAIFSRNTAYYQVASLAINLAGGVSVPLHAEMQPHEIEHAVKDSHCKAIFVGKMDSANYKKLQGAESIQNLHQITMPLCPEDITEKLKVSPDKTQSHWAHILEKTGPMVESPIPRKDELATIVYTSGSSGLPKGVEHTYGSMSAALTTLAEAVNIRPTDRMLSHLMLSHVAERAAVETSLYRPMTIDFSESPQTLKDDIMRTKPTVFLTIPKVWAALDDAVADKVSKSFLRFLAPCTKDPHARLVKLFNLPLIGNSMRKLILKKMGLGEARLLLSGAGPISADITRRYKIGQGYGATENYANVTVDTPDKPFKFGTVGAISKGVEYRLEDPASGEAAQGQGELLVKSDSLMKGYHNHPEKTAEVMTKDGFFKTGDLASVDKDGYVTVLGRISSNFKNKNGVFINTGPIQQAIKSCASPHVEDAFVFYDEKSDQPAAALQLSVVGYKKLDRKDAMYDPAFKDQVTAKMQQAINQFNNTWPSKHEKLSKVVFTKQWTQDNGLLNSTNKPKIPALKDHYADVIRHSDTAVSFMMEKA